VGHCRGGDGKGGGDVKLLRRVLNVFDVQIPQHLASSKPVRQLINIKSIRAYILASIN